MGILDEESSSFYPLERVISVIEFDQVWGMCLIGVFPGIVAFGVPFPFDQVLKLLGSSLAAVCFDLFDFILFFSIN